MSRKLSFLIAMLPILACLPGPASLATEIRELISGSSLTPDVDTPHPSEKVAALEVRENVRLVTCELGYGHSRNLWIELGPGDFEDRDLEVDVPKRAKIKVAFEIVTDDETIIVGKRRVRLKKWNKWGHRVGWVDGSGHESGEKGYKSTAELPVDLEAGDMLLVSFLFTEMPDLLGIETTDEGLRRDSIGVSVNCRSCGSNDTPCREF